MQETQETWVRSLDWEDPLEEEMATLSSSLACKIPWTEVSGGLQSKGSKRIGGDLAQHNIEDKESALMKVLNFSQRYDH